MKAFHSVDYEILLRKLSKYEVRGTVLRWFRSYRTDRKQFVVIDGHKSHFSSIKSGVPQGSSLGVSLFIKFITDFLKCTNFF